jgi:hypothetical protein
VEARVNDKTVEIEHQAVAADHDGNTFNTASNYNFLDMDADDDGISDE